MAPNIQHFYPHESDKALCGTPVGDRQEVPAELADEIPRCQMCMILLAENHAAGHPKAIADLVPEDDG